MDKNGKLQRYSQKDYTDTVHFPVEIIGRDGIVRQYSFEDSIRLYQRRVTFAAIRYGDRELMDAELEHCRARICQLRRSYFHWFGWGSVAEEESPEFVFGELAGEVTAFLRRVLRSVDRVEGHLSSVGGDDYSSAWYVQTAGLPGGLLYVYDFRQPSPEPVRERFFTQLKDMEGSEKAQGDNERLVAFHHGGDCAFIFTAKGSEYRNFANEGGEWTEVGIRRSPLAEALRLLRAEQPDRALALCRDRLEEFPWHRQAYYMASSIAFHLGRTVDAEEFGVLGVSFFPDDPEMHYRLGRVRIGQGRHEEGLKDLYLATDLDSGHRSANVLLSVALLRVGRLRAAQQVIAMATSGDRELLALGQFVRWRRVFGLLAMSLLVVGTFAVWTAGIVGLLLSLTGIALLAMGWFAFTRFLEEVWKREMIEDPRHANFHFRREEKGTSIS